MIQELLARYSASAFGPGGPNAEEITLILEAAVRAPDHGKLHPWRFIVVEGEAREKLSRMFVDAARRRDPEISEVAIEKERGKPLRSALTIIVAAKIALGHKIPAIEQVLSAGAAAMNILNAAWELGYGAKWVTGANAYDDGFKEELGLAASDALVGFIHIGGRVDAHPPARPDPAAFTRRLGGRLSD
jgi:nitroreductase